MGNYSSMVSRVEDDSDYDGIDDLDTENTSELSDEVDVDYDFVEEPEINMFLQRLLDSGEISSDCMKKQLPYIKGKPNLERLKKSSIYQSILNTSGHGGKTNPDENWSIVKMISTRGLSKPFTKNDCCKIYNKYLPNKYRKLINGDSKFFCGTFSKNGNYYVAASQDHMIRIFDGSTSNYRLLNKFRGKHVSWCILDIDFSPNNDFFVYSTWSDCLHVSRIDGTNEDLQCLYLNPNKQRFCVFSLAYSNCGREIIGGASDGCLYIYDKSIGLRTLRVPVTSDEVIDVNAVGFADSTSNIFFSGTDDGVIKIWDRRSLNESRPEFVGTLIGHVDGITYIDSKNDGRHLISNSKDQSIKLWDIRVFSSNSSIRQPDTKKTYKWDYRWDDIPKQYYSNHTQSQNEYDASVMTYKGHEVSKSLIRAKFSPLQNTGQRYIYTGCGTGRLIIYDILTGLMVKDIDGHRDIVRDVSWHPTRTEILTASWDYNININSYEENLLSAESKTKLRRSKRLESRRKQSRLDME